MSADSETAPHATTDAIRECCGNCQQWQGRQERLAMMVVRRCASDVSPFAGWRTAAFNTCPNFWRTRDRERLESAARLLERAHV